jgi:hypothetical protein
MLFSIPDRIYMVFSMLAAAKLLREVDHVRRDISRAVKLSRRPNSIF